MKRRDKGNIAADGTGEYLTGPPLYHRMREITGDKLVLAFSRGKDSIAMWLELRDYFTIIPYYCYMVPGGLSYERESLDYYERFFGTKIHRFLHPLFWKNLNGFLYQPPQRVGTIIASQIDDYEYSVLADGLGAYMGIERPYVAFGYRVHDSPRRRLLILREGPIGTNLHYFWPIWNWTVGDVAEKLKSCGVKIPRDYEVFGWTFTATDYQYIHAVRDNFLLS